MPAIVNNGVVELQYDVSDLQPNLFSRHALVDSPDNGLRPAEIKFDSDLSTSLFFAGIIEIGQLPPNIASF